ncbi:uncharacterized protein LOC130458779 isoform X1 [Monodelphis domestica]|uniref:uncharacterized protein LOC130458779 isoform X1 n=2 Tax=Monodelphis domestica TaxID=13616 RepID=UPI0024E245FF|nr:uncharacterized protein LOC130458779 isoform X1 [Monodelphis domestica]
MESLLPRDLKAGTGRLPAGTSRDRESAMSNHSTPPFDPRFPYQNQTRNCYQNFRDFHRCTKIMKRRGKDSSPCDYYRKVYHSLCPLSWLSREGAGLRRGGPRFWRAACLSPCLPPRSCSAGRTRSGRGRSPGRSEGPPEKSSQPAGLTRRLLLKN